MKNKINLTVVTLAIFSNILAVQASEEKDLSNPALIIKRYEKSLEGVERRSQTDIQQGIDQHTAYGGLGRQTGTEYEKRTWGQYMFGRNEDPKIDILQSQGMEVSRNLSSGANITNLAKMVDQRDTVIKELVSIINLLQLSLNDKQELFYAKEKSFGKQSLADEKVIKAKDDNIDAQKELVNSKKELVDNQKETINYQKEKINDQREIINDQKEKINDQREIIKSMKGEEKDSAARIINIIKLLNKDAENIEILHSLSLKDAILKLENLVNQENI